MNRTEYNTVTTLAGVNTIQNELEFLLRDRNVDSDIIIRMMREMQDISDELESGLEVE